MNTRVDYLKELWISCVEDKSRAELLEVITQMMDEIERLKVASAEREAEVPA